MPEIIIKLSDILKDRNMTQSDLVALTGIRSEAISNLTRGNIERLSLLHLQKIMTALEITDVGELLQYVVEPAIESVIEPVKEVPLNDPIELLDLPNSIFQKLKRHSLGGRINTVADLVNVDLKYVIGIGALHQQTIAETLDEYLKSNS